MSFRAAYYDRCWSDVDHVVRRHGGDRMRVDSRGRKEVCCDIMAVPVLQKT
jgi:hypothetical protein